MKRVHALDRTRIEANARTEVAGAQGRNTTMTTKDTTGTGRSNTPEGRGTRKLRLEVRHPRPRYRKQGSFSGEEIRENVLIPAVAATISDGLRLEVMLEDADFGYPIGWIEEVFGGLVRRIPEVTTEQVTPVSTKYTEAATEALECMQSAATGSSPCETRNPAARKGR